MKAPWIGELSSDFRLAMDAEWRHFFEIPCYEWDALYMNAGAPW
jgi:hypothetical protein